MPPSTSSSRYIYKAGERFKVVGSFSSNIRDGYKDGLFGTVTSLQGTGPHGNPHYAVKFDDGRTSSIWNDEGDMQPITKNNNIIMSIKSKAALLFKKEPEKSFIKAGIIDENENFTSEGRDVFLNWLLKKNGDDFNKEVVTPILEEEKKNKTN